MTSPNTEKLKSAILSYLSRQQGNESADKDNLTYEAVRLTLDSLGENPDDSYTVADFKLLEYLTFLKDGSNHRYAEIRQLVTESSLSDQQKIDLDALLEKGEKENVPLGFFTNSHFGKCLGSQTDETAARIISKRQFNSRGNPAAAGNTKLGCEHNKFWYWVHVWALSFRLP